MLMLYYVYAIVIYDDKCVSVMLNILRGVVFLTIVKTSLT